MWERKWIFLWLGKRLRVLPIWMEGLAYYLAKVISFERRCYTTVWADWITRYYCGHEIDLPDRLPSDWSEEFNDVPQNPWWLSHN